MSSLFRSKEKPIETYSDFWDWFEKNEQSFHSVLKNQGDIANVFFNKLAPKLDQLKEGLWYLAGMHDDNTAELIITADGVIKNIPFIEDLVVAAPPIKNWKITAMKQPSDINQYGIKMDDYTFLESNMSFYAKELNNMPDEIDIVITHKDFNSDNKDIITNGVYLALDNSLGELNFATKIDNISVINPSDAQKELIPIVKLKEYLNWREKEFVEKYSSIRKDTSNDNFSGLEGALENNLPLLAIMNMDLLKWDAKASHPWIVNVEIKYNGKRNNGMPNDYDYELLNQIENNLTTILKDSDGYLNIGRETANSLRNIYFACIEFREPSKVLHQIKKQYQGKIEIEYTIYKDKYWQSFNRFLPR